MWKRKHLLLMLAPGVVFFAVVRVIPSVPWPWAWGTGAIVLSAVAIVLVDRRTRLLDDYRRSGRCHCGFDLRATPPKETSVHSFGVDESMSSTKKIIVCPECGAEHIVWEDR